MVEITSEEQNKVTRMKRTEDNLRDPCCCCCCQVISVVSDSVQPHIQQPTRLHCPWNFPGNSTGVDCHFLLQGIFLTQGLNPGLPHCRQTLNLLSQTSLSCIKLKIQLKLSLTIIKYGTCGYVISRFSLV